MLILLPVSRLFSVGLPEDNLSASDLLQNGFDYKEPSHCNASSAVNVVVTRAKKKIETRFGVWDG